MEISTVDIIGKGISTVIACFMQSSESNASSNVNFCLFLLEKANFCADVVPQYHITELKLYLISFALRYLEEVEFDQAVSYSILKVCRLYFQLIEDCTVKAFCHEVIPVQKITLFETSLVSVSLLVYTMTEPTWEQFESMLWEHLLGTKVYHLWIFIIECFAGLAEQGLEMLVSTYICKVIPKLLGNGQNLTSHTRLSHLSDSLMKVSRKYQILLKPEDISEVIYLPMENRTLLLAKLNMLYHNFSSGLIWNSLPLNSIENLAENVMLLWQQECELLRNDAFPSFQMFYLLVTPIVSLKLHKNNCPQIVIDLNATMMKSWGKFVALAQLVIEELDRSNTSVYHVSIFYLY